MFDHFAVEQLPMFQIKYVVMFYDIWYAHLREMNQKPWIIAALVSWGIALVEYLFQVPANRIGHQVLSVGQLKILQEVITLGIFVPFSVYYLKEPGTIFGQVFPRSGIFYFSLKALKIRHGKHEQGSGFL